MLEALVTFLFLSLFFALVLVNVFFYDECNKALNIEYRVLLPKTRRFVYHKIIIKNFLNRVDRKINKKHHEQSNNPKANN